MTVGNITLYCREKGSNRPFTISVRTAATVDLYQKIATNGIAATTSPDRYKAPTNFYIYDIVLKAGLAMTGVLEFEVDGRRTQVLVDVEGQYSTNSGRPALMIPFSAGSDIMIRAATTIA